MGSLYFASDKAIYDALTQRSLTSAELRKVFLSRGIVISNESDKKFLASRFSALFHDYYDYRNLSLLVGGRDSREKTTNVVVTTAVSKDKLTDALTSVKEWLVDDQHEQAEVAVHGDQLKLTVKYQKLDLSQAEFRQVVEKTAEVILEKQGSGWKITGPMNEKFKDITDQLYSQLEIMIDQEVVTRTISLEAVPDASIRTNFLRSLIRNLKDMEVVDVVDVSTFNPKDREDDDLDLSDDALVIEDSIEVEDENDGEEGEDGDPEVELARPQPEARTHKIIRIDRASLKGKGVLESKQLSELEGHGFYLWKIRWTAREKLIGSEIVQFEAQFGNQAKYCDFSYIVKGVYNYHNGKYSKSLVRAAPVVEQKLKIRLEEAAQKTLDDIERGLRT
ncbi:TPA: hypothetical protein L4G57_002791 [Pseudomonas aeruginosa]|uniref:Uncharacterized protein n=5 Tax=Pseudomonas aeruginosa TaxID=287 RepID=A0A7M3AP70_PSEAI|nr:hypothetical protein [Pseudomonas aeruginosa]KSI73441.1 hypothetical protein AO992_21680 [Pseudomonas aeruginosa]KSK30922.1 hypothetical protein APA27_03030 [Pseudomonas aeruginosa]KSM50570.1 hypothetical protein APA74_32210 [Pseudomonas aeruginosa]KSO66347.1 hypothetical protein APA97_02775 [Pseudomonas aeruginosa]MBD3154724.1 hypothetical protein [Pseudomonas aeruginosa]